MFSSHSSLRLSTLSCATPIKPITAAASTCDPQKVDPGRSFGCSGRSRATTEVIDEKRIRG
jgi:hypothetical protein